MPTVRSPRAGGTTVTSTVDLGAGTGAAADPSTPPSLVERAVDRIPFLEKELFLLYRLVQPGDVCVDVGAAGGAHLFVMARRAGPRGQVIGVEPRPGSYRVLRRFVRAIGWQRRVRLVQTALADRSGRQRLRIPVVPTRAHFHGSSDDRDAAAAFASMPHRVIEVATRTLDDVVAEAGVERVDVVKCDVEGAELLVLAGASWVLDQHRPILIVEADDTHQRRFDTTAQDVLAFITQHGYVAHCFRRGALVPVAGPVPNEDDYIFVPSEQLQQVAELIRPATGRPEDPSAPSDARSDRAA